MSNKEIILSKTGLENLAENIIFSEKSGKTVKIIFSEDVCDFEENDFILYEEQMKTLFEYESENPQNICNLFDLDLLPVIEEKQNECFLRNLCEANFVKDNKVSKDCNEKLCRLFKIQLKYACKYKIQRMITKPELNHNDIMTIISSGTVMKELISK
ncbi:MAG: hypothetical protein K6C94_00805 [Candidatus Gastranaerophilales bacterium]|nr:hypothetical protein [Candidatus Gastranaerophilales bacterium]